MEYKNLLIHIGYHKTGSTWFQNKVFNNRNFGFVSPWGNQAGVAVDYFINSNPFKFECKKITKKLSGSIKSAELSSLIPVLSNEALSGTAKPRQLYERIVADRLYACFPYAKILIIIREQKSMILSSYKQYIMQGGTKSFCKYIDYTNLNVGFLPECNLECYEYDSLINYYFDLFDKNNVLVLLFEDLKNNPQVTCDKLTEFLNINTFQCPANEKQRVSLNWTSIEYLRLLNKLNIGIPDRSRNKQTIIFKIVRRIANILNSRLFSILNNKKQSKLEILYKTIVGGYFADSNKRLEKILNQNLSEYGYH